MSASRASRYLTATLVALAIPVSVAAGGPERDFEKAREAYLKKDYAKAEKYLRAVTRSAPDFAFGHLYLGHSLFYQSKFQEAIPAYEKARELGKRNQATKRDEVRVLTDQLGMAYGLSGRLDDAKALFEAAIQEDPSYPLYYYNLACTFAELGRMDEAISNLKLGFERRENMLAGETYPNPRMDDSFKRLLGEEKFEAALKEMGFGAR